MIYDLLRWSMLLWNEYDELFVFKWVENWISPLHVLSSFFELFVSFYVSHRHFLDINSRAPTLSPTPQPTRSPLEEGETQWVWPPSFLILSLVWKPHSHIAMSHTTTAFISPTLSQSAYRISYVSSEFRSHDSLSQWIRPSPRTGQKCHRTIWVSFDYDQRVFQPSSFCNWSLIVCDLSCFSPCYDFSSSGLHPWESPSRYPLLLRSELWFLRSRPKRSCSSMRRFWFVFIFVASDFFIHEEIMTMGKVFAGIGRFIDWESERSG